MQPLQPTGPSLPNLPQPASGRSQPEHVPGTIEDTFYHHVDWSGYSGKTPLEAGLSVLEGGHLRSRGFHIDTWHGVLREAPRQDQVTLVFSPDMPARERASGIFERPTGSGVWLSTDKHLEGVLFNGPEVPQNLVEAVDRLNEERAEVGLPGVDLLTWKTFHDAWPR